MLDRAYMFGLFLRVRDPYSHLTPHHHTSKIHRVANKRHLLSDTKGLALSLSLMTDTTEALRTRLMLALSNHMERVAPDRITSDYTLEAVVVALGLPRSSLQHDLFFLDTVREICYHASVARLETALAILSVKPLDDGDHALRMRAWGALTAHVRRSRLDGDDPVLVSVAAALGMQPHIVRSSQFFEKAACYMHYDASVAQLKLVMAILAAHLPPVEPEEDDDDGPPPLVESPRAPHKDRVTAARCIFLHLNSSKLRCSMRARYAAAFKAMGVSTSHFCTNDFTAVWQCMETLIAGGKEESNVLMALLRLWEREAAIKF